MDELSGDFLTSAVQLIAPAEVSVILRTDLQNARTCGYLGRCNQLHSDALAADTKQVMTAETDLAIGTKLPLLFTYRDTLFGNGFVVEVQASNGRALCVREADDFWIYGLNPGGMAAHGADPDAAHSEFRRTFSNILIDLASESGSFEEFQAAVSDFFNETNDGYEHEWREAVDAVQRGLVTLEGVPLVPANSSRSITVTMKEVGNVTAQDNSANLQYLLAA